MRRDADDRAPGHQQMAHRLRRRRPRSVLGCGAWAVASGFTAIQGSIWMLFPTVMFLVLGVACLLLPHWLLSHLPDPIEDAAEKVRDAVLPDAA